MLDFLMWHGDPQHSLEIGVLVCEDPLYGLVLSLGKDRDGVIHIIIGCAICVSHRPCPCT